MKSLHPAAMGCLCCLFTMALGSVSWAGEVQDPAATEHTEQVRIVLEGVIVSPVPSRSVALVRRESAHHGRAVRVGETAYGLELVEVTREGAVFVSPGGELRLALGDGPATATAAVHVPPGPDQRAAGEPERSGSGDTSPGINHGPQDDWVRRDIERLAADERLAEEMPVILEETELAPWIEGGEVRGLRLNHIPDGTLLSETGLLPGDVLLSINDVPVQDVAALAGLYPLPQSQNEIRVVVERDGLILKLAYVLH